MATRDLFPGPLRLRALAALAVGVVAGCATAPQRAPLRPAAPLPVEVEVPAIQRPEGETAAWWFRAGAAEAAARGAMEGRAKNLILFVGDGMSLTTVAAARILGGQRAGQPGEEWRLAWEEFPATAFSRTYNTDLQTPDSAGTMTAMATGAKTRAGHIGVGPSMAPGDCTGLAEGHLVTLWELAAAAGMETGIVTTTRLTHATPAATLAHVPDRDWESDADLPAEAAGQGCRDIALQMVESPFLPRVMLGGGRSHFLPQTTADPEYPGQTGNRLDGRDLVRRWQARTPGGAWVWNLAQLEAAGPDQPLLGLFEPSHMRYEDERADDPAGEPSLAQMTRAAITRLQDSAHGFLLLVEGGRIDHAHHAGWANRALNETLAMDEAVRAALALTSSRDTLILVTADHSHTLSFAGYPARGNPIGGTVAYRERDGVLKTAEDVDGKPYTTLGYANGPGHVPGARPHLGDVDTAAMDYRQEAVVPLKSESHGGEDVGVWASGPGSAAVRGSVEQNTLFHFLLQAHPRLRQFLCERGGCNRDGIPVELPRP